ncbi:1-acyl-sn-glycerol-3-phosphate acyltransferase [Candidatus Hepatincolaceae symbiont of Richtersius coronifer]
MLLLLRNFFFYLFIIITLPLITIGGYIYSFFCTPEQIRTYLTVSFKFFRKVGFFITDISIEYKGVENFNTFPCIIASKHQSAIETSFFFNIFHRDVLYIAKKEITKIPLWGRLAQKFGGVLITRTNFTESMRSLINQGQYYINQGASICIFPEGTRVSPKIKDTKFKAGVSKLYSALQVPVIPVALNTGIYYSKKSWLIYPGHIIIEFLPAIRSGMPEKEFLQLLESTINEASYKLFLSTNTAIK